MSPNKRASLPELLIKSTTSNTTPIIATATGSFYLPIQQKSRKGSRYPPPPKHLRKPPSFDTYIRSNIPSTTTSCGYMTRSPSLSSSYSSTSSFEYGEDMSYGSPRSINLTAPSHRLRRGSSPYKEVRFAETSDDVSSIVSSSSSIDEWDDDIEEEEEEEYIIVPRNLLQQRQQIYYHHKKSGSA